MSLVATPRIEFLRDLADEILGVYAKGRTIVAVDGTDAAARVAFADDLAAVLADRHHQAFRASLGAFGRPRTEQAALLPEAPERLLLRRYDLSLLRRVLIDPFRMGGSTGFVTRAFDLARDAWIEPRWLTGPADSTLVIDGEYLHRRELRDLWSYGVLVESADEAADLPAAADLSAAAEGVSDGGESEDEQALADRLYRAEVKPRTRVAAVIDLTDPERPARRFLDSC